MAMPAAWTLWVGCAPATRPIDPHIHAAPPRLRPDRLITRSWAGPAGVAAKPSCIAQTAVAHINRHLRPRAIHIITTSERQCFQFRQWAGNVRCHLQDRLLPGLTRDAVAQHLQRHFAADGEQRFKGRTLAGWYLQQVRGRAARAPPAARAGPSVQRGPPAPARQRRARRRAPEQAAFSLPPHTPCSSSSWAQRRRWAI
jgi:hypothetical protein